MQATFRELPGLDLARNRIFDRSIHGVDEFRSPTVVDTELEGECRVVLGEFLSVFEFFNHRAPEAATATRPHDADPGGVKFFFTPADNIAVKSHEETYFFWRAFPVFSGKSVGAQILHADFHGPVDHVE